MEIRSDLYIYIYTVPKHKDDDRFIHLANDNIQEMNEIEEKISETQG